MRSPSETVPLTAEESSIVEEHKGLVYDVGKRLRLGGRLTDDVIQAGYLGLIAAVQHFRPERGYRFSTYASRVIRQRMICHVATDRLVWLPEYLMFERVPLKFARQVAAVLAPRASAERVAGAAAPAESRAMEFEEMTREVRAAVGRLGDRHRLVVERRMAGDSYQAIGDLIGLSKERVRDITFEAHRQLRDLLCMWRDVA